MLASLLFSSHCGETYIYQTNIREKKEKSRLLLSKGQDVCGNNATSATRRRRLQEVWAHFLLLVGMFGVFLWDFTHNIIP